MRSNAHPIHRELDRLVFPSLEMGVTGKRMLNASRAMYPHAAFALTSRYLPPTYYVHLLLNFLDRRGSPVASALTNHIFAEPRP